MSKKKAKRTTTEPKPHGPEYWQHDGKRIPTAVEVTEAGNEFAPQLHFTGMASELMAILSLIEPYRRSIVAYYLYTPWPATYSLEMQFGETDEQRQDMLELRKKHNKLPLEPLA